jgi:hypothetical protein
MKVDKGFFAVDKNSWQEVCKLGMNTAAAYLVIATGTQKDNQTSLWSVNAISQYTRIGLSRAKRIIDDLEKNNLLAIVKKGSKTKRPKYKLKWPTSHDDDDLIWLPKTIVMGLPNSNCSPVEQIRETTNTPLLQIFIELYHTQNLAEDGGISRRTYWRTYKKQEIAEYAQYII